MISSTLLLESIFFILEKTAGLQLVLILVLVFFYTCYAILVFSIWAENIAGKKLTRCSKESPSNKQVPDVKSWEHNRTKTINNSRKHDVFKACKLLQAFANLEVVRRIRRTYSENTAERLNMDHIYINFSSFLWAHTFIGPFSYALWKIGVTWLSIRQHLHQLGVMTLKPFDPDLIIGKLCLEQSQVVHYSVKIKKENGQGYIAGFFFPDFPYIDQDSTYRVANLFTVEIDLDTKKFIKAKLDDSDLLASQTMILLWFNTIAAQHVKLHAMANWAVNVDNKVRKKNPFFYRNSVVTSVYNYFGYSCFKTYMKGWEKRGLLKLGFDPDSLIACFDHGIRENIVMHQNISDLSNDSRLVKFVIEVRGIFLKEFTVHRDSFPGVNPEAMFVGTVLHSLDHTLMEWNLEDPLWLDVNDTRFGVMAQIGRIVRVGFVEDVPLLYFHKRFKGSKHPFYEAVYEKAAKIDIKLADNMDTCIIK